MPRDAQPDSQVPTIAHSRDLLDAALGWLERYEQRVESLPVLSRAAPGDLLRALPDLPPQTPDLTPDALIHDLDSLILPGLTHWQHPAFFAYFPANASPPALLGDLLASGLGVQGMLWVTSPACTELETRVLDWLRGMIGLPESFDSRHGPGGGVIQGTASEAVLVAMVAARDRARRHARAAGTPHPEFTVYASTQAHSSVIKAAMIAGIADAPDDHRHIRLIDTDRTLAMRPDLLARAVAEDMDRGLAPCFVAATLGTTATGASDPLAPIARAIADLPAGSPPVWLHADAAHLGSAFVCPEFRAPLAGVERADSLCFNPHKWLLTTFDCSCFFLKDRTPVIDALSVTPDYLRNPASDAGSVIDYRDWQIPLGRRFRSLKLWLVLRAHGVEGLRAYIREHARLTDLFTDLVRADPRFEIVAPPSPGLVCFRIRGTDAANRRLLADLNATGRAYLTHASLPDPLAPPDHRLFLRCAIGGVRTAEPHVRATWSLIQTLVHAPHSPPTPPHPPTSPPPHAR
ncbi:MAG: aspartate aminotransferase family protein [Phycisphaeraceae bacterium]|nr:MAG: aspartate aminotransferase family protein [Phycisphaeraceae bacterium]